MSWHVPETLARAYVAGDINGARAASVEAHVMSCAMCRELVSSDASAERLNAIWSSVEDVVDSPRTTWVERLLMRLGVGEGDARLVAAAPSLRASWFLAMVAVLAFATWASQIGERGVVVFLIVAPIVPVLAVAGAYGPRIDPTYEVSVASPYPTLRLMLLRSGAVVVASGVLAGLAATVVPDARVAVAWLLPAVALLAMTLMLTRWLSLPVAGASVATCYAVPLIVAFVNHTAVLDTVLSQSMQFAAMAIAIVAFAVAWSDPHLRASLRRNS